MGNRAARKIRLTDANAGKFRPEESEYTIWDTKTPGLGVRVKPTGYRAWVYHESTYGRPRRHSLGPVSLKTVEEARQTCLKLQVRQEDDKPANVPAEVNMPGFREFVAGEWKAARYDKMKPSSRKGADSYLKTQLLPNFGKLPLDRITRSRIDRWFDRYNRRPDLGLHGVLGGSEERFDAKMLFDPFEKQFHLPAAAVQLRHGGPGHGELVGEEVERLAGGGIPVLHATQGLRVIRGRSDAREHDGLVAFHSGVIPRDLFADILRRIDRLRPPPAPA